MLLGAISKSQILLLLYFGLTSKQVDKGRISAALADLRKSDGKLEIKLSSGRTLNCITGKAFYKIAVDSMGAEAIGKEYRIWNELKADASFQDLVMESMELSDQAGNAAVLKMPRLQNPENYEKNGDGALMILRALRRRGRPQPFSSGTSIEFAMEYIKREIGEDAFQYFQDRIALQGSSIIHCGPAHGDFYHRNILWDQRKSRYLMIDLERFSMDGVQEFDAIHYLTEYYKEKHRCLWQDVLAKLKDTASLQDHEALSELYDLAGSDLYDLYYLDRIGKELQEYAANKPSPAWLKMNHDYIAALLENSKVSHAEHS